MPVHLMREGASRVPVDRRGREGRGGQREIREGDVRTEQRRNRKSLVSVLSPGTCRFLLDVQFDIRPHVREDGAEAQQGCRQHIYR